MMHRIQAENIFVTRIKTNTLYQTLQELDLPEKKDQDILKDEIIVLTSNKAVQTGISEQQLRLVHVYKEVMPNFRTTGMNEKIFYTSDELLEIFKEQHRLFSPLDPIADETFVLTRETKIWELQDAQDLIPWDEYSEFLNQEFRIDIPRKKWKTVFNPSDKQTLGDLCDFLSTVAEKEIVKPVKRLGAECLSAAIFLTLKRNLKNKGVNVSDLRPSTKIEEFLDINENFSPFMEEVTLTGVKTFDKLEYGKLQTERRFKYWIDKIFPNWVYKRPIKTGDIQTFRDLVEKIIDNEKLGITSPIRKQGFRAS